MGTLSTKISSRIQSLKGLGLHLEEIREYLAKVVEGKLPVNHEILIHLQDIFNLLPNLDITNVIKSFAVTTNDEMLAIYLSSMIRAVISLHGLIDNKLELKEAEKKQDKSDTNTSAKITAVENKA